MAKLCKDCESRPGWFGRLPDPEYWKCQNPPLRMEYVTGKMVPAMKWCDNINHLGVCDNFTALKAERTDT